MSLIAKSAGARPIQALITLTDGNYLVTTTADSGAGSLRQAIIDSIATSGPATIGFSIPAPGVQRIALASPLPILPAGVTIDGTTQPGYAGTPMVELLGDQAGAADGLTIIRSRITIRGLAIGGFASGAGILISGPAAIDNSIQANVIGTDPSGKLALPNGTGITLSGDARDNTIGGTAIGLGNLIADNAGPGIVVNDDGTLGNRILGNRLFGNSQTQHAGIEFDGSGAFVQLPSYALGGAITFEAWVRSDDVNASWARVFDFGDGPGTNEMDLAWNWTSGTMGLGVQDQNNNWSGIGTSDVFPQGKWVYVAVTIDGQGNAAIYWNGTEEASGFVAVPPILSRAHMYLGRSNWEGDSPLMGAMQDVAIWSGAHRRADQPRHVQPAKRLGVGTGGLLRI